MPKGYDAPEQPVLPLPVFTPAQIDSLIGFMVAHGEARRATLGEDMAEVDFLCGCMTTLFALGEQGRIPAKWVFGPMSGRRVFGPDPVQEDDDDDR